MQSVGTLITTLLASAEAESRSMLYEHEGYRIIAALGLSDTPKHVFVSAGEDMAAERLTGITTPQLVIKIVAPDITHKTEIGGVEIVRNEPAQLRAGLDRLRARAASAKLAGTLVCEYVESASDALGHELFVGLRMTREFGFVLSAGLGGTATEPLAEVMRPGRATASASAALNRPDEFLRRFKETFAYALVAGQVRGRQRILADEELLRCFGGFLRLAHETDTGASAGRGIVEFEINPLRVANGRMVALDAVARVGDFPAPRSPRPLEKIEKLLQPRSIAIAGVSSKAMNLGRIILGNIRGSGFAGALHAVKPNEREIDGTPCAPSFAALPAKVDLAVLAVGADQAASCARDIITSDAADAVIVIPGGMGETAAGADIERTIRAEIVAGRRRPSRGPVFLGGNCMGVQSRPGHYDTFFIPTSKWDARMNVPPRRLALVSQSGAFLITRLSNIGCLDPAYAVTLGNQIDLTVSDILAFLADDPQLDTYGVYLEGLVDLDGIDLARAVQRIAAQSKTVIVYRAGRTPAGRSATAGHTSVLAGDYAVSVAVLSQAGALVARHFREFEQLVELSTTLHDKHVGGMRLAAITNAGFEAVGMADALAGDDYRLSLGSLGVSSMAALGGMLKDCGLEGIVNPGNPLDLTPMAADEAYARSARTMLDDPGIDAVIVSLVPLTPKLRTTAAEMAEAPGIAELLGNLSRESPKPLVAVVDSGPAYDALVARLRAHGLPVFRAADEAAAAIGRYMNHRLARAQT